MIRTITMQDKAVDWLSSFLSRHPNMLVKDIQSLAKQQGFNLTTLRKAASRLNVISTRVAERSGGSRWSLPKEK